MNRDTTLVCINSTELRSSNLLLIVQLILRPTSRFDYYPSHKCRQSPKPNSDRLAFVIQLPDWLVNPPKFEHDAARRRLVVGAMGPA